MTEAVLDISLLRAENLWFSYDGETPALRGVSLEIYAGEWLALVGCNGSGKSTLVKHFNGLLRPQEGRVVVAGMDTGAHQVGELARAVAYLPQHPDRLIFSATVREEVGFAPRLQGLRQGEITERVEEALGALDLTDLAEVPPATLGYGLRRKVALAAVLAQRPRLLILDEPTTGLDVATSRAFLDVTHQRQRAGMAVAMITHDLELAAHYADRVAVMRAGEILALGEPRALFSDVTLLEEAGLRPLPVTEVAGRLHDAWDHFPTDILTPQEFADAYQRSILGARGAG